VIVRVITPTSTSTIAGDHADDHEGSRRRFRRPSRGAQESANIRNAGRRKTSRPKRRSDHAAWSALPRRSAGYSGPTSDLRRAFLHRKCRARHNGPASLLALEVLAPPSGSGQVQNRTVSQRDVGRAGSGRWELAMKGRRAVERKQIRGSRIGRKGSGNTHWG
jgi:hypothetical protein